MLLHAHDPTRLTRLVRHCVRDVVGRPCSPRPAPFPPPPPQPVSRPCSAASQVLRGCQTSHARPSQGYGLGLTCAARPAINRPGGHGISRFSRMETPYMRRVSDRAGSAGGSRITPPTVWPSARYDSVGTPNSLISRLNTGPARTPVNASPAPLQTPTHDSGPSWVATPFNVERSHLLLHAGLSRRSITAGHRLGRTPRTPPPRTLNPLLGSIPWAAL